MSRLDKYLESVSEILKNEFSNNIERLVEQFDENGAELELQIAMQTIIDRAIKQQKIEEKGTISYISFSMLLSSLQTENYSFGINLYDETFFIDEIDTFIEWKLGYLSTFIDSDIEVARKHLLKGFIGIVESDILEIKHIHALNYMLVGVEFLKSKIQSIIENLETIELKTTEIIKVTYGLYMEKQGPLYNWEVRK